ncbi:RND efflux system outer membrane lipoprotein [Novosphingobium nitrogenifigens DSM 19370]|uniref:RND efflux system outer membrane lipoprotein n=1 Tax=Novosphingobium nitrogenifigens DSM 19370 TaxID=983920 RepID=F1ZD23_9SPHN|nr:efflux transporter outer membrane subunit [Novosphingobium nitrogenifigens]EGD57490.1 RND efflux system outer membrane lipoprotein [Novosphingobium nitrogenifigens DSM 19370]
MARLAPLLVPLALAGCSLAPKPRSLAISTPDTFAETPANWAQATPLDGSDRGEWWAGFGDPVLDDLETRAAKASPTLEAALARREEARAVLHQQAAQYLPEIDATASAARNRVARDRPLSAGHSATYDDYRIGSQLSYEVDLWGRVRNSVAAARAESKASDADLASIRLSLQASVADAYARLRGLDAEEDLLIRSVEAYTRALDLTRKRHEGGVATGLDENRARTVLGNARAQVSDVAAQRAATEHELAALVGEVASGFRIAPVPRVVDAPAVPVGTPSTLIQRRPDISAAERRVAAANARIGVARAALFPTVTLGLAGGFESTGSGLLSSPNAFWALGPLGVSAPIFDAGKRIAGVRLARAQLDEAAANYRTSVLTAFREVEDALAAARQLKLEAVDQKAAAEAAEASSRLAFTRYREGAANYFEVVTAQTDALTAQRAFLTVQTRRAQATVAIVRALGGPIECGTGCGVKPAR